MQTTLAKTVTFKGVGLHSGEPATVRVRPASAEHGIWFKRTDVALRHALVPARWDAAEHSPLCTRLVNDAGVAVQTVEHLMAALVGCGIHNALIEVDGFEVPILDGSSAPFVVGFLKAGLRGQLAQARAIRILRPVEVKRGEAFARLEPASEFRMAFDIDFVDEAIGFQRKDMALANGAFVHELCDSRTFCRQADVDSMRAQGLALGGTLENAVVVDGDTVLSPGGLRYSDEAVRHKMLDAVGDLGLAGAPILGRYVGHRAGHTLTNQLLHVLFSTPGAFEMVDCDESLIQKLPGTGVDIADLPEHA